MNTPPDITSFVRPEIKSMQGYTPGLQLNDDKIIKLNSNENPYPPSAKIKSAIERALREDPMEKYPDPTSARLRKKIAQKYDLRAECILIGNGSDEVLTLLFRALLQKGDSILIADPSYSLYPVLADICGAKTQGVPVLNNWHLDLESMASLVQQKTHKLCILAQPNAPTGLAENEADILSFIRSSPIPVLIDEAYADFHGLSYASYTAHKDYPMLMTCGTFSKSYSLAGLRIGWLSAPPAMIQELDKIRDSYNLNRLSQIAALAALDDQQEFEKRISLIQKSRAYLKTQLEDLGFDCLDGKGNFLFCKTPFGTAKMAQSFYEYLESKRILIRYFKQDKLHEFVRISIGQQSDMELLVKHSQQWCKDNNK